MTRFRLWLADRLSALAARLRPAQAASSRADVMALHAARTEALVAEMEALAREVAALHREVADRAVAAPRGPG